MSAMKCSDCGGDTTVLETRAIADGLRRRRVCMTCKVKFTTVELRADGGQRNASYRFVLLDQKQMRQLDTALENLRTILQAKQRRSDEPSPLDDLDVET